MEQRERDEKAFAYFRSQGLSVRASNCLVAEKLFDRDAVVAAMQGGLIKIKGKGRGGTVPNLGKVTIKEIRAWLGM